IEITASGRVFDILTDTGRRHLGRPGVADAPLFLPADATPADIAWGVVALAAVTRPRDPHAAWMIEVAMERGLTLAGSATSLRWRLTELYALADQRFLALDSIATMESVDTATAADAARYRARTLQFALLTEPDRKSTRLNSSYVKMS